MLQQSDLPTFIDNKLVDHLNNWMKKSLVTHTENGKIDVERMIHNATYNIGEVITEASGLIFQEKLKLDEMESKYDTLRSQKYDELMNKRMGYEKTKEGINLMLDGQEDMNKLRLNIKKQKHYIEYLENFRESVKYYCNGVKVIIDLHNLIQESGKVI